MALGPWSHSLNMPQSLCPTVLLALGPHPLVLVALGPSPLNLVALGPHPLILMVLGPCHLNLVALVPLLHNPGGPGADPYSSNTLQSPPPP